MLVFLSILVLIAFGFGLFAPVQSAVRLEFLQRECVNACPTSRHPEFMRALVCGDRSTVSGERAVWSADFEKTGLVHLVVVSGTHLILLEALVSRVLTSRARFAVLFVVLGGYVVMTGASPPVTRAFCSFFFRSLSVRFGWNWTRVQVLTCSGFAASLVCRSRFDLVALFLGWIAALAFEFGLGRRSVGGRGGSGGAAGGGARGRLGPTGDRSRGRRPVWRERMLEWRSWFVSRLRAQIAVYVALVPALLALGVPSIVSIATNLIVAPGLAFVLFPASVAAFALPSLVGLVDLLWDFVLWLVGLVASLTPDAWPRVDVAPVALVPYILALTIFFRWRERVRRLGQLGPKWGSAADLGGASGSGAHTLPDLQPDEPGVTSSMDRKFRPSLRAEPSEIPSFMED